MVALCRLAKDGRVPSLLVILFPTKVGIVCNGTADRLTVHRQNHRLDEIYKAQGLRQVGQPCTKITASITSIGFRLRI